MQQTAEDLKLLVKLLRHLRNWTQAELAQAAGLHKGTIRRYEDAASTRTPDRRALAQLSRAASVPMWANDGVLLPAIALARELASGPDRELADDAVRVLDEALAGGAQPAAGLAVAEFLADPDDNGIEADGQAPAAPCAQTEAQDPWDLIAPPAATPGRGDLEWYRDFESLTVRLCAASVHAAADDPRRALDLARRALRIAATAFGEPAWGLRLQGYAWPFVGNAQRVGGELLAAQASFAVAWRLWRAGVSPYGSALAEWRLLDLEASLCRDRRQFDAALDLLDRALAAAPAEARGRILLKKAFTLEQAGSIEAALAVLREAAPLADLASEPRLRVVARFNAIVLLCHLGLYPEAEERLAELRPVAQELGNEADELRLRWLDARVAAGLGRREEASGILEAVREAFARLGNGYDTALASLELAVLHLEAGRIAEVRRLVATMLWTFEAQEVHREAMAALTLFRQAVETETITADLAARLLRFLERARGDERLVFEDIA